VRAIEPVSVVHSPAETDRREHKPGQAGAIGAARLACRLLDAPLAMVGMVAGGEFFHEAWPACPLNQEPLTAFCGRVIGRGALLIEPGLSPGLDFAVGVPLGGAVSGALCVFGVRRDLTNSERHDLADLAALAARAIDLDREAELRAQAEAALASQHGRLAAIVESLPFNFWICDASGRYLLQNAYGRTVWADHTGLLPADTDAPPALQAHWTDTNRRALAGEIIRTASL
jgi:PAS domain-containing protein